MANKCKVCGGDNRSPLNGTCGYACRAKWLLRNGDKEIKRALKTAERERKAEQRKKRAEVKGYGYWAVQTQKVVNRYIVLRDRNHGCITCGKREHELRDSIGGVMDAGHFRSVGSAPLRFYTLNIHKQCRDCNGYKGGRPDVYRDALISRYGQWLVDKVEQDQRPRHYTIDDLKRMRRIFNKKIKRIA